MATAIITGGSRGLGRAIAEGLVDAGWRVVLDGRDADALDATFADPGYQDFIAQNYIAADETDAATTAANLQADRDRYGAAIEAAGITP